MANKTIPSNSLKEHIYFVQGMHCASCEILIEKELLTFKGVKSVEAKTDKGQILIEYSGDRPQPGELNKIFQQGNYIFSDHPFEEKTTGENVSMSSVFGIAFLIILGFLALNKLGLAGLVNVNSKSSLITFFGLGIIAGISSCAALVGGLVLSMSKQWSGIYADKKSTFQRIQPHIMFNAGRILCYAILGMLLGFIGSRLQISPKFSSFLIVAVSGMMVFLALQLLGVGYFRKFQFTLPKFITRKVADESNFKGRYMPLLMGALTFFLPCGFTITAQGMALLSGNPIQGSLIMLLFALGTAPSLFLIGLSSIKLVNNPRFSASFLKVAGVLVLFFAFFNINSQLNVLGISSLNDIFVRPASGTQNVDNDTVPVVDGKQIIKMEASASGYKPNYFKVKVGVPVRWEITDTGTSGCTNAVISNSLFDGPISLTPGQVSVKEFTPKKTGKYKFSCWMGMISGTIEVVDKNSSTVVSSPASGAINNSASASTACGCGNSKQ